MACGYGDEKIYKEKIASSCDNELAAVVVQGGGSTECWDEWLKSNSSTNNTIPTKHKIQKIPRVLRQMDNFCEKCYEPQVISIGPYHHGKEELKPMEKLKIRLTMEYVKNCKSGTSANLIYNKIARLAEEARKCYDDNDDDDDDDDDGSSAHHFDNKEFVRMMFLDGCFLLQFIFTSIDDRDKMGEKLNLKNHDIAFIQRDLFLLENQLPFIILKALMIFTSGGETEGLQKIKQFIKLREVSPPGESWWEKAENFFANPNKCRTRSPPGGEVRKDEDEPAHLLELMRREIIDPNAFNETINHSWYSYRSVQELKATGIIFRPNRSKHNLLTDVRYEPLFVRAILRLPVMVIDDLTKSLLLNLVAYEMCPDSPNNFGVTSYL